MPVSIKDVARIAGVSPGTVSRALRDSPRVHPKTKERIHTIAEEMGYVPNTIARSLVTGQTYTVGLVVTTMTDPFLGSLAQTVEFTANGHGYTVILTSSNNQPEREIAAAEMFQTRRVDGVIVTSSRIGALYQKRLERLRVPVVLINSLAEYKSHNIYSIGVDNHHGGYLATQHLLQKGHQRIAYVASPPGRSDDEQRMAGYRDALVDYLRSRENELDDDSRRRLDSNPLRILDSKNPEVQALLADAPLLAVNVLRPPRAGQKTRPVVHRVLEGSAPAQILERMNEILQRHRIRLRNRPADFPNRLEVVIEDVRAGVERLGLDTVRGERPDARRMAPDRWPAAAR